MYQKYKDAGVDINAGDSFVQTIKPLANATARPGVIGGLGGFGALFDLKAAGYSDPILVSSTDGVGTKLKLASTPEQYRMLGVDLVAMCVNDIVVQGAQPLFFLDYYATGGLSGNRGKYILEGIASACTCVDCALIGGETAEMPGVYQPNEFDLAGFAVGAVERQNLLTGELVKPGDRLLGLPSSGLHANGFSLVRALLAQNDYDIDSPTPYAPWRTLSEDLLKETRLYVKPCMFVIEQGGGVHALAHITGGGLLGNIPRVVPEHLKVELFENNWHIPRIFKWLQRLGGISSKEMLSTFNCGIGMVLIVGHDEADNIINNLGAVGEMVYEIGWVVPRYYGEEQITMVKY